MHVHGFLYYSSDSECYTLGFRQYQQDCFASLQPKLGKREVLRNTQVAKSVTKNSGQPLLHIPIL